MKKIKNILLSIAMLFVVVLATACSDKEATSTKTFVLDKNGIKTTITYTYIEKEDKILKQNTQNVGVYAQLPKANSKEAAQKLLDPVAKNYQGIKGIKQSIDYQDDKFVEDQDEYYDIFGYKNPDDPRLLVSDPMNTGNTIINRGNKKGKILFAFSNILVAFVIIIALALIFEKDWKVEISNTVKISTMLYKDNIKQSDIENLELLDKFPNKRAIRMNGGATKEKAYGNFSLEGEGNVRLYIFKKTDKVIKISRKNQKTVYINKRTNEETEELFEKLKNFVDK